MESNKRDLFFFIGTEAELIKIFPVIIEARRNGLVTHIIASGQNDIKCSSILKLTDCGEIDLELSDEADIRKSAAGLICWWLKTYFNGSKIIGSIFGKDRLKNDIMIVHGDTVSTYMGARIGKRFGMTVCHVEAGLRSHHLFNPFPEEIDRLLTSRIARIHFAPGQDAVNNLVHAKGKVFNTEQNTLLDSLRISEGFPIGAEVKEIIEGSRPYFVFVMHRQENLAKKDFVCDVIKQIEKKTRKQKGIIVGHKITIKAFKEYGVFDRLIGNPSIMIISRMEYFDFMKLLNNAEFVITDGGSNQEELYYMGKPTLILRKKTERNEGIGINAQIVQNIEDIASFPSPHNRTNVKKIDNIRPSEHLVKCLMEFNMK